VNGSVTGLRAGLVKPEPREWFTATAAVPVKAGQGKVVKRTVELAQGKYKDFNDHHLTEKLKEQEKIKLCREKIRQLVRALPQEAARDQAPKPPRKTGQ
jgi:hypothetical protein